MVVIGIATNVFVVIGGEERGKEEAEELLRSCWSLSMLVVAGQVVVAAIVRKR
jgi:hypothetical protein